MKFNFRHLFGVGREGVPTTHNPMLASFSIHPCSSQSNIHRNKFKPSSSTPHPLTNQMLIKPFSSCTPFPPNPTLTETNPNQTALIQCLPDHVHAKQLFLQVRRSIKLRPHSFIAHTNPLVISPHLCSPHPRWLAQDYSMGVGHLIHLYVSTLFTDETDC